MRDITLINAPRTNFETLAPAIIPSMSPGWIHVMHIARPVLVLLFSFFPRFSSSFPSPPSFLTRRKSPTYEERVIESAKGKMKRAVMIYFIIRGISEWNCVYDIVRYIRGVYIFLEKGRERERDWILLETTTQQHETSSYPIPVKRFCKKARCIKREKNTLQRLRYVRAAFNQIMFFHELHVTLEHVNGFYYYPTDGLLVPARFNLHLAFF